LIALIEEAAAIAAGEILNEDRIGRRVVTA
jgi:hypothetical protein